MILALFQKNINITKHQNLSKSLFTSLNRSYHIIHAYQRYNLLIVYATQNFTIYMITPKDDIYKL